jgi:hypothetical protein
MAIENNAHDPLSMSATVFCLLAALSRQDCHTITSTRQRLTWNNSTTYLVVQDSFFADQENSFGGAILIEATGMAASILDSTFLNCSATPYDCCAIYTEAAGTFVRGCCANRCRADWGHFVECEGSHSPLACTFTTLVECSYSGDTSAKQAAISIANELASGASDLSLLNFTACYCASASSVIAAFGYHPYRCNFFTVNGCLGQTGIDNQGSVTPTISNSNCYGSTLSYAVLYFRTVGMEVVNCIFRDNTIDIGRKSDGAITVSACVFSDSKLTGTWITYTDSCAWDTRTNSHALCHVRQSKSP